MFFIAFLLFCLVKLELNQCVNYDRNEAEICVILSAKAYCNKEKYESMLVDVKNFQLKTILYDKSTDMEGYIGTTNDKIYIVFRGSSSVLNWIEDSQVLKTKYPYCSECYVHNGFYKTVLNLKNVTLSSIAEIQKQQKVHFDKIIVTGHSYGAAVATLMALELNGAEIYNYGQPRIGNEHFAKYVNEKFPNYWRFTHDKDMVPHLPPMDMDYYHSCGEIFEKNGTLTTCQMCEDETCSMQYQLQKTNTNDHLYYLGTYMDCYVA